ncbi:MAG: aldehyde dehydrogenase family protein [Actinomycetota bacterium]|nr:aldehyde dehydrogenase family protein [Acidimicrobiia bacterium]MDQ3293421.1 aldehyde dehydrogenase family protein [Actinomycetota bacterium]
MTTEYRMLIGGERAAGARGTYEIVNPATEAIVGAAPEASVEQAEQAAAAAAAAFPAWSRTKPEHRAELLNKAGDLLRERMEDLIPLVQAETGATLRLASTMQVPTCIERLRRYAKGALEPTQIPLPPSEMPSTVLAAGGLIGAVVVRQPVGVVACITPYNFPIVNMAGKVGPALAMGNTVVVKPAPQDPLAVTRFGEVFADAGFPPGVVNVVTGSSIDAGEALVASKHVDMVSFTGSTTVGQRIGEVCGRGMKRQLMELGGKGAGIVFDDADLKTAIGNISSVWAFHAGQICTAPTRVIVQRGVYDQVVGGLSTAAGRLKVGDPLEPDTVVGPLISSVQRGRVEALIQAGRDEGGEVVVGGDRPDRATGFYLNPTLIAGCKAGMRAVQEEFFGPVVVVLPFDDEDEAVALANSTEFGLYDYVFSADTAKAMRVARQLRTGNVGINTAQRNHEAPFGGFKQSGVGRDGGSFGLHAYSELQSIVWPG